MPTCPRCRQPVDAQAITCPYCRTALKAYGHPGMPLYQAKGEEFLCETCIYHEDNTCNYPQRPYAKECILYQNRLQQNLKVSYKPGSSSLSGWLRRNSTWLVLVGLVVISLVIALRST
ncbi:MAG: zinc ribbon domain-containing protein [Leptolyngbyaceae cyanobacterium CRU_2_3]|nr:zinc ribbon domain-containing protein [Leptolyngbyaceae cyanobacterium CRU_2_3]